MKKLIALFCVASAVTAFADTPAASDNVFGVLRVDSTATQTIVSIPWAEAGTGDPIKVKDAIKTTNLTKGDQLFYYDAAAETPAYKFWQLGDDGWEGATTVLNGIKTDEGSDEDTLARGGALILVRQKPTKEDKTANPFYLYGQYTTSVSSTTCIKNGYTLLAPPSTSTTDLNNANIKWETPGANDNIVLQNGTLLHYRNGTWGKLTKVRDEKTGVISESVNTTVATIAAGEGAWYINNQSNDVTVRW